MSELMFLKADQCLQSLFSANRSRYRGNDMIKNNKFPSTLSPFLSTVTLQQSLYNSSRIPQSHYTESGNPRCLTARRDMVKKLQVFCIFTGWAGTHFPLASSVLISDFQSMYLLATIILPYSSYREYDEWQRGSSRKVGDTLERPGTLYALWYCKAVPDKEENEPSAVFVPELCCFTLERTPRYRPFFECHPGQMRVVIPDLN